MFGMSDKSKYLTYYCILSHFEVLDLICFLIRLGLWSWMQLLVASYSSRCCDFHFALTNNFALYVGQTKYLEDTQYYFILYHRVNTQFGQHTPNSSVLAFLAYEIAVTWTAESFALFLLLVSSFLSLSSCLQRCGLKTFLGLFADQWWWAVFCRHDCS